VNVIVNLGYAILLASIIFNTFFLNFHIIINKYLIIIINNLNALKSRGRIVR